MRRGATPRSCERWRRLKRAFIKVEAPLRPRPLRRCSPRFQRRQLTRSWSARRDTLPCCPRGPSLGVILERRLRPRTAGRSAGAPQTTSSHWVRSAGTSRASARWSVRRAGSTPLPVAVNTSRGGLLNRTRPVEHERGTCVRWLRRTSCRPHQPRARPSLLGCRCPAGPHSLSSRSAAARPICLPLEAKQLRTHSTQEARLNVGTGDGSTN